jgi:hypothetical protein
MLQYRSIDIVKYIYYRTLEIRKVVQLAHCDVGLGLGTMYF